MSQHLELLNVGDTIEVRASSAEALAACRQQHMYSPELRDATGFIFPFVRSVIRACMVDVHINLVWWTLSLKGTLPPTRR